MVRSGILGKIQKIMRNTGELNEADEKKLEMQDIYEDAGLEEMFMPMAQELAKSQVEMECMKEGNIIEDKEKAIELKTSKLVKILSEYQAKKLLEISEAFDLINEMIPRVCSEADRERVHTEFQDAAEKFLKYLLAKAKGEIEDVEGTMQELLGFSDETMRTFYSCAYALSEQNEQKKAEVVFQLLVIFNPYVPDFWMALGMMQHSNEDFEMAQVSYQMALQAGGSNPTVHYWAAQACIATQDIDIAKDQLKALEECAKEQDVEDDWQEQIGQLKDLIALNEKENVGG